MSTNQSNNHLSIPQTPSAKSRFANEEDDDATSGLLDHRLSVDSKLSWSQEPGKEYQGQLDPDGLRQLSVSPFQNGRLSPSPGASFPSAPQSSTLGSKIRTSLFAFWERNRGVILVAAAQLFGALMNLTARLLELEGEGMHPFQVLFARQSLTMIGCCVYMYWRKIPDFPLGAREVRWILVARGLTGFFGIYGLWYSMMYLPLAEATVITFLAPSVAGYICYVVLREPFTRIEQIASVIALMGVVFIAHPASIFSSSSSTSATPPDAVSNGTSTRPGLDHETTGPERLLAIGAALMGVFGAAGAFTTIRWIGKRAHPLISVNYFATWSTIVSLVVLTAAPALDIGQPAVHFALPGSVRQWIMLLLLGVFGFIMQFMMTAGLGMDRSNRANAMVYTHMLFAAGFDRWVFGNIMEWMSVAGCGLIIGSAMWVILTKKTPATKRETDIEVGHVRDTEALPMLLHVDDDGDDIELDRVPNR